MRIDLQPQLRRAAGAGRTYASGIAGDGRRSRHRRPFCRRARTALTFFREKNKMKSLLILLISAFILVGCNTVQGFGKDVKKAGEVVEHAAQK
jgi:predicted small secreted protein